APLLLEVSRSADILHTGDVLDDYKDVKHEYYLGGTPGLADYNYIVESLTKEKAVVLTTPMIHRLPQSVSRFHLVGELIFGGCEVGFVPASESPQDLETFRMRAADMARSGIERADAVKALTLNTAKAIGADKHLGTIEKGKDADLVFLSGDILDPAA